MIKFLKQIKALIFLIILFIYEVSLASVKVLWWIYKKPRSLRSAFFELPISVKTDAQKILIAHFITLTPGTLAVDIQKNSKILVHLLEESEKDGTIRLIQKKVEPLVKELWRQS
jgi:multicomponent Na+:H+ antiporter subunit E